MITPSFGLTATERVLPKLALDFTTATLDPRITFTRALNTATRVNSSGVIVGVNADTPRFDYNPVTLACNGLLIEEARTNLILNSQDVSGANYTLYNVTYSLNSTTSPDGTANADTLIATAGTNIENSFNQGTTTTTSTTYTASVFAKKGTHNYLQLYVVSQTALYGNFDLSTGTKGTTGTGTTSTITDYGNGWYRCTITYTTNGTNRAPVICFVPSNSATRSQPWSPVGTETIYIWGFQFEAGAFATSYIPTTSAALTRNADVATMTGTNFSDWYNASEGSFAAQYDRIGLSTAGSQGYLFNCAGSAGSGANRLAFYQRTSSQEGALVLDNNVTQFNPNAGAASVNTVCKATLGYKASNYGTALNGASPVTQASGTVPSATLMYIGSRVGASDYLNGHLQKLSYWPQRLINAEIQAFSK